MTVNIEILLTFDEFGWCALEEQASAEGFEVEQLVALACSYHESELAAERVATVVPRFRRRPADVETRALELELGDGCLRRLKREAEHQGVALERLCEHAALLYLADLDTGKVAERVVRRAPGANSPRFRRESRGGIPD
jgi:hypothetical protein